MDLQGKISKNEETFRTDCPLESVSAVLIECVLVLN